MATTSKDGSRRANYPLPKRRGSDKKYRCHHSLNKGLAYRNERNLSHFISPLFFFFLFFRERQGGTREEQLEGKSGASSRGNSSSNSIY